MDDIEYVNVDEGIEEIYPISRPSYVLSKSLTTRKADSGGNKIRIIGINNEFTHKKKLTADKGCQTKSVRIIQIDEDGNNVDVDDDDEGEELIEPNILNLKNELNLMNYRHAIYMKKFAELEEIQKQQAELITQLQSSAHIASCASDSDSNPMEWASEKVLEGIYMTSVDQVYAIEEKLQNPDYFKLYISTVRRFKPTNDTRKSNFGLGKIMSDEVLVKFNWRGALGRLPFVELKYLNSALHNAWCENGSVCDQQCEYENMIRTHMSAARGRRNQQFYRFQKRNSEIKSEFVESRVKS